MLTVTRASSPPVEEYMALVRQVLESLHFTNQGPMVARLEAELSAQLQSQDAPSLQVLASANGTLALEMALRALGLEGKRIITTPFTYVATLSAILAVGATPLFVDIDPQTLCITPETVQQHLSEDVSAILPVHIYGNTCDVTGFNALSESTGIPVVYDAAHSFGTTLYGKSVFSFGACAIGSFHATKIMHTAEGGCVACQNKDLLEKLRLIRAFGHVGDTHIMPGINAKMSDLHAALGLCILPLVEKNILARKALTDLYDDQLAAMPLHSPLWRDGLKRNYAYYPIIFENEAVLLRAQKALREADILPRRYFYPALTRLPYAQAAWKTPCPVAESISERVLCLPMFAQMTQDDVERIVHMLGKTLL